MKIFGYSIDQSFETDVVPNQLAEITLVDGPDELRKIAKFISHAANRMDAMKSEYSHLHLSDWNRDFSESPQFVIFCEKNDA